MDWSFVIPTVISVLALMISGLSFWVAWLRGRPKMRVAASLAWRPRNNFTTSDFHQILILTAANERQTGDAVRELGLLGGVDGKWSLLQSPSETLAQGGYATVEAPLEVVRAIVEKLGADHLRLFATTVLGHAYEDELPQDVKACILETPLPNNIVAEDP